MHLKNLSLYKDVFDEVYFVFSYDDDTNFSFVLYSIVKVHNVIPNMKFKTFKNNEMFGESLYFYNEIATKLDNFDKNDVLFFAHNDFSENLQYWINIMYFANLYNIDRINNYANDDDVLCMGTFLTLGKYFDFMEYGWHYSGTFFWFKPYLMQKSINERNKEIPQNERYFTEAFFGSVIPYNDRRTKDFQQNI